MDTTEPGPAHVHIDKQSPHAYRTLVAVATAVSKTAAEAGLSPALVELINTRVSLINGCPSCLEIHHRRAVKAGVTDKQLATLRAWRDTELFSERTGRAAARRDHHDAARPRHRRTRICKGASGTERRRDFRRDLGGHRDQRLQPGVDPESAPGAPPGTGCPRCPPAAGPAAPTRAAPAAAPRPEPRRPTMRTFLLRA